MASRRFSKGGIDHSRAHSKDQSKGQSKKRELNLQGKLTSTERLRTDEMSVDNNHVAQVVQRSSHVDRSQTNGLKHPGQTKRAREKAAREQLVLWRKPLVTILYATKQLSLHISTSMKELLRQRFLVTRIGILFFILVAVSQMEGPHQVWLSTMRSKTVWCFYWIGLGVLSSVGLGTGLHTFVLYLGPHIASVAMAAYECGSLDFPEPPYPNSIECPPGVHSSKDITVWAIMSKVRLEAMMWGLGTALGELPPYFMARAARLSGFDPEDEDDLREFQERHNRKIEDMNYIDRAKVYIERLVERVGFLGILACASIPNPLFDLAGITCGHFLVPFWKFFGATVIGKAVFKMHLQKLFVIIAFNESLIEQAMFLLSKVPFVGIMLQSSLNQALKKQKQKLYAKGNEATSSSADGNIISTIFELFVVGMIAYFVVSIINSLAQSYHKRKCKDTRSD